jgi:hypothetical protein
VAAAVVFSSAACADCRVVTTSLRVDPNEAVTGTGGSGCATIAYNITVE